MSRGLLTVSFLFQFGLVQLWVGKRLDAGRQAMCCPSDIDIYVDMDTDNRTLTCSTGYALPCLA